MAVAPKSEPRGVPRTLALELARVTERAAIAAARLRGKGDEKETRLAERIEIGLFTAEPGRGAFDRKDVIRMERQPIRSGRQVLTFVTDRKPTHAGIDPYNFYIDRNSDDNVSNVTAS